MITQILRPEQVEEIRARAERAKSLYDEWLSGDGRPLVALPCADVLALCATVGALRETLGKVDEQHRRSVEHHGETLVALQAVVEEAQRLRGALEEVDAAYRRLHAAHDNVIHDEEDRIADSITEDEYEGIRNECLYTIMRVTRAALAQRPAQEPRPQAPREGCGCPPNHVCIECQAAVFGIAPNPSGPPPREAGEGAEKAWAQKARETIIDLRRADPNSAAADFLQAALDDNPSGPPPATPHEEET